MSEFSAVTAAAVRAARLARTAIALLEARQEGRLAEGRPVFAASFPLGRLEALAYERLPRRSVTVVVYGMGKAAATWTGSMAWSHDRGVMAPMVRVARGCRALPGVALACRGRVRPPRLSLRD